MVNMVAAYYKPLLHRLMNREGVKPHTIEIEPGTVMNFWVPTETIKKPRKGGKESDILSKPTKPALVLIHGFVADGIVTWQFQVGALAKKYSVYIPDLLFFGGSITDKPDRSTKFQAECLVTGLRKLGVDKCKVVGFSYGGMVAFKIAESYPDLVEAVVVSGSAVAMTDSISESVLSSVGFASFSEMLLPSSVKGLRALLSTGTHKKLWFPDRFHRDFLEVMFTNRKERAELLEGMVLSDKDATIPSFAQKIHLLWGGNDKIFNLDFAQNMKEKLGDNATFKGITKAGHLVHLERPCAYNRCLKRFLASPP